MPRDEGDDLLDSPLVPEEGITDLYSSVSLTARTFFASNPISDLLDIDNRTERRYVTASDEAADSGRGV